VSVHRSILSGNYRGPKSEVVGDCIEKFAFFEKRPLTWKIFKILFRRNSSRYRSTSCMQISWNLADRKSVKSCVIYLTNNKTWPRSIPLASARIAPKICQGRRQTMYLDCPKFHPNRFTSGGVTAERVNTIQTRHKVFPILGEAIASRPVTISVLALRVRSDHIHISWDTHYTWWQSLVKINRRLRPAPVERSTCFVWQTEWLCDSLTHKHTNRFYNLSNAASAKALGR